MILVGTGGPASLEQHRGKSKCIQSVKRQQDEAKHGKSHTLFDFGIEKQPAQLPNLGTRSVLVPSPIMAISLRDVRTPDACNGPSSHRDTTQRGTSHPISIIDVDAGEDEASPEPIEGLHVPRNDPLMDRLLSSDLLESRRQKSIECRGIHVPVPVNMTPYTAYPFGMHENRVLPWNIHIVDDKLYLQSTECQRSNSTQETCLACGQLRTHNILEGILDRIRMGIHENTPHDYQPIAGLREIIRRKVGRMDLMRADKMNTARKLGVRLGALGDQKRLIMAVAYGGVQRVDALLRAGLKNKAGAKGMMKLVDKAMQGLYRPKNFTEEEMLRSLVFLKLGGARVAEISHKSMGTPGVSTLRRHAMNRPIRASPSFPTTEDVCRNVDASFDRSGCLDGNPENATGYVLMFDEIAVERRPRWDDSTNKFAGICREHSQSIGLEFCSLEEVEALAEGIVQKEVHLASEVSVAALPVPLNQFTLLGNRCRYWITFR
jgi:hypothetical protein